MTTSARPLRADAARNRSLVVDAARRLFAARGLDVTLHDVAEEAGVGVGTVYRRFEDKEALLSGLLEDKYEALLALAGHCAALPTGREGLRAYLLGAMSLRAGDKALSNVVLSACTPSPVVLRMRQELAAAAGALVERARAEGAVREGFTAEDVPAVSSMIGSIADRTRVDDPDAWRRYGTLVVDAVCPPEGALPPLAGRPLPTAFFTTAR